MDAVGERVMSADLTIGGSRARPSASRRQVRAAPCSHVADLGQMLKEAGWLDGLANGFLHIEAASATPPRLAAWHAEDGPYRLQKVTPRDGISTLNSTIDGLSRAGNAPTFDSLEAIIAKTGDRIQIKAAAPAAVDRDTAQGFITRQRHRADGRRRRQPLRSTTCCRTCRCSTAPDRRQDAGLFAISTAPWSIDDLKTDINMMSATGALRAVQRAARRRAPRAAAEISARPSDGG
jgi:hypothetical protein